MMLVLDNFTLLSGFIFTIFIIMNVLKSHRRHNKYNLRSGINHNSRKKYVIQNTNLPRPNQITKVVSPLIKEENTFKQPKVTPYYATSSQQPTPKPEFLPKPEIRPNLGKKTTSVSNLSQIIYTDDKFNEDKIFSHSSSLPQLSIFAPLISYKCQRCENKVDMRLTNCSMHKNDKIVCSKCFKAEWK